MGKGRVENVIEMEGWFNKWIEEGLSIRMEKRKVLGGRKEN